MNKSRRDFIKKFPFALSIPFSLSGFSVKAMGDNALTRLAAATADDNPRRLVILQLHGGNDGLNCLIPVEAYDEYYRNRANIAIPAKNSIRKYIPLDSTLPSSQQVGLHPDMQAMKTLYDQARMTIVQGVSYQNNNGSHFRGRDIQFMGGSATDYYQSGWVGRYLQKEYSPAIYPNDFPSVENPDPLAIEIGDDVSLLFHQEGNIPTSLSLTNIEGFAELVNELEGFEDIEGIDPIGIPPLFLEGSPYYKELQWILDLEDKSQDYAARLKEVYDIGNGKPKASYPSRYPFNAPEGSLVNRLSQQLKIVANLIAGGCQTKVFLVRIGGFDTHADQVVAGDPTMGGHAALMYHVATSMKSFQEDLRIKGYEDDVLSVTTSEFGRRVYSNGSYGTDHGTAGPIFIFGKGVQPGVVGDAFATTSNGGNLAMQYDYRNIYANIIKDWMWKGQDTNNYLDEIFPGLMTTGTTDSVMFEPLPIAATAITGNEGFIGDRFSLEKCYPNPAKDKTTISFKTNSAYTITITLYDDTGKEIKPLVHGIYEPGTHAVEVDLTGLRAGHYIYEMKTGFFKDSKKLVIIK